jgi:putative endonuclease
MKKGYVYIISNKHRTVYYTGVTNDLERRMFEHKSGKGSIFTKRYNITDLLYFEEIYGFQNAIDREKQLKKWKRDWKDKIIKEDNPNKIDLAEDWFSVEEKKGFV